MATFLGYGPTLTGGQPSVYRKRGDGQPDVPATSAMLLTVHLDPDAAITSTTWRAGGKTLAVTPGAGGRVDLRPAAGASTLYADVTRADGSTLTIDKATRLTAATPADEQTYAAPPAGYTVVTYTEVRRYPSEADVPADIAAEDSGILAIVP